MISFIRNCLKLLFYNIKSILLFAFLYTFLSSCLSYVVVNGSTLLAMKATNINYIADNNLLEYICNPFSWLMAVVSCFALAYLALIFACAIVYAINASRLNKKVSVKELFVAGINYGKKTFSRKSILLVVYTVILLPFISSVEISNACFSIDLPGFILDAIFNNTLYTILFFMALFVLFVFTYNIALVIPIFTIEDVNFQEAKIRSRYLMKGQVGKLFAYDMIVSTLFAIIIYLVCHFAIVIVNGVSNILNIELIDNINFIIVFVVVLIGLLIYKCTCMLFYTNFYFLCCEKRNVELNDEIVIPTISEMDIVCSCLAVLLSFVLINTVFGGINYNNQYRIIPNVAAHRGDSVRAPENSLPAFQMAIDEKVATWVELDVHQTKDGVIIVSHDDNLSNIGIDLVVHESTYEELMKYDSGAYFSKKYEGLKLCTLKEALDVLKDKVAVQVEIKPTEYDDHIEEAVLDIIKETDSSLPIAVLSLKEKPLKRIKELDPDFPIIYCTVVATEGIENIDYADFFSIEESAINKDLVSRIHEKGKQCFVWTINKEDNVQYLVDCGVDTILTDDPIMMKKALTKCNYAESFADSLQKKAERVFSILRNIID